MIAAVHTVRLTIPAREAIQRENLVLAIQRENQVLAIGARDERGAPLWSVELVRPPAGLVVVGILGSSHVAIRLADEPRYPAECAASWWDRGAWIPCPRCGAALAWSEAGRVPGARTCLAGHRIRLSADGHSVPYRQRRS